MNGCTLLNLLVYILMCFISLWSLRCFWKSLWNPVYFTVSYCWSTYSKLGTFLFHTGFVLKLVQNRVNFMLVNFLVQDPVEMELSVRIPFELPLFRQSVINWDGGWKKKWIVHKLNSMPWNGQKRTWRKDTRNWKRW